MCCLSNGFHRRLSNGYFLMFKFAYILQTLASVTWILVAGAGANYDLQRLNVWLGFVPRLIALLSQGWNKRKLNTDLNSALI